MNDTNIVDDSNLAQCECCGYVMDYDDVPTGSDPFSGEVGLEYCPECNNGGCIGDYDPAKAIIRERGIAHQAEEPYRA
jgi:hypothetical protein